MCVHEVGVSGALVLMVLVLWLVVVELVVGCGGYCGGVLTFYPDKTIK